MLEIVESIQGLHFIGQALERGSQTPNVPPQLDRLVAAVAVLDTTHPARPPVGLDEYVRQWKDYLDEKLAALEPRAIRNLCWHQETASDETFQYYFLNPAHSASWDVGQEGDWRPAEAILVS